MKKLPLVSVIINCFNGEKYIESTLNSLLKQNYSNWHLIFWDNCSIDNTRKIFYKFKDRRFQYYRSKKHTNLSTARKLAMKFIKGEYFAFLDSDDFWFPNKLSIQIKSLEKNKNCGFVYSNSSHFNEFKEKKNFKNKPPSGNIFFKLLNDYFINDETVIFRTKIFKENEISINETLKFIPNFDLTMKYAKVSDAIYIDKILSKWRVNKESLTWKKNIEICDDLFLWHTKEKKENYNNNKIIRHLEISNNKLNLRLARILLMQNKKFLSVKFLLKNRKFTINWILTFIISFVPFVKDILKYRQKKLYLN